MIVINILMQDILGAKDGMKMFFEYIREKGIKINHLKNKKLKLQDSRNPVKCKCKIVTFVKKNLMTNILKMKTFPLYM